MVTMQIVICARIHVALVNSSLLHALPLLTQSAACALHHPAQQASIKSNAVELRLWMIALVRHVEVFVQADFILAPIALD